MFSYCYVIVLTLIYLSFVYLYLSFVYLYLSFVYIYLSRIDTMLNSATLLLAIYNSLDTWLYCCFNTPNWFINALYCYLTLNTYWLYTFWLFLNPNSSLFTVFISYFNLFIVSYCSWVIANNSSLSAMACSFIDSYSSNICFKFLSSIFVLSNY